jgi:glutamate synthase domain-containing protein 3
VVEGVGDHGCEYMTKGLVVVLGKAGRNFAAGMNGGFAYVFDEQGDFAVKRCNLAGVDLEPVLDPEDTRALANLVSRHFKATGSPRAKHLLNNWADALPRFVKVFPHEFKRVLGVPRVSQPYIPGQLPPPAAIEPGSPARAGSARDGVVEQVQHG